MSPALAGRFLATVPPGKSLGAVLIYILFVVSEVEQFLMKSTNINPIFISHTKCSGRDFPGGTVVENLPANAGDTGSSPGLGRSHMPRRD